MDLVMFGFLAGAIVGGIITAGLLLCAFYFFTRNRGRQPANDDIEMQAIEEVPMSSSIPSVGESSTTRVLVDEETGMEFSYVRTRANHLGRGSFGAVYKGICSQSKTAVAIKLIDWRQRGNQQRALKYYKREVETLKLGSRLNRNVTKFFGSVMSDPECAVIMEYCEGGQMSRWLEDTCSASATDGEYLVALFEADLKPSNVFITRNATEFARGRLTLGYTFANITSEHHHRAEIPFTVKIGDFGLARILDDSEELTAGIGTEAYMAPEVRRGSNYGTQSDLYSLGVMLKRDLESADFFSSLGSNGIHPTDSCTRSDSMRVILDLTNPEPTERPTIERLISTLTNFALVEHSTEHTDDEVTLSLSWTRDA